MFNVLNKKYYLLESKGPVIIVNKKTVADPAHDHVMRRPGRNRDYIEIF